MEFERESELENAVGQYFLTLGYFCQKNPKIRTFGGRKMNSPLCLNGTPDIYIVRKGYYIGIEVKLPKGTQSDAQIEFEAKLRKRGGGLYYQVRSLDDARNVHLALVEMFGLIFPSG